VHVKTLAIQPIIDAPVHNHVCRQSSPSVTSCFT